MEHLYTVSVWSPKFEGSDTYRLVRVVPVIDAEELTHELEKYGLCELQVETSKKSDKKGTYLYTEYRVYPQQ